MIDEIWEKLKIDCPIRKGNSLDGFICTARTNIPTDRTNEAGCYKSENCLITYWLGNIIDILENKK